MCCCCKLDDRTDCNLNTHKVNCSTQTIIVLYILCVTTMSWGLMHSASVPNTFFKFTSLHSIAVHKVLTVSSD